MPMPDFDLERGPNRFDYLVAAVESGIMSGLKGDKRWAVLCALYGHLPNCQPGKERVDAIAGVAASTTTRALKSLRELGLIDYADGNLGGRGQTYDFTIADIRLPEVRAAILDRLKPPCREGVYDKIPPDHDGVSSPKPPDGGAETPRSSTLNPPTIGGEVSKGEVRKVRAQEKTEERGGQAPATSTLSLVEANDQIPEVLTASEPSASTQAVAGATTVGSFSKPEAAPGRQSSQELSDAEKHVILSEPWNIWGYLNFGSAHVRSNCNHKGLEPTNTSWFQHIEPGAAFDDFVAMHPENWTKPQFAAFYWWYVCAVRKEVEPNAMLTMPFWANQAKGRLLKAIGDIVESMPAMQALVYLITLIQHFPLIQHKLGRLGDNLELDITTPTHTLVRPIVQTLSVMSPERLDAEYARMHQEQDRRASQKISRMIE